MLAVLEEAQLDRVGCFAYSPVEGAKANELPGALADEVREERRARFMQVQAAISRQRLKRKIGRTLEILVDEVRGTTALGRSAADAPEIDGVVHVRGARGAKPGDRLQVKVTGAGEHDLKGIPVTH
jgi:ribosomal protein S12 methylthiotransferase